MKTTGWTYEFNPDDVREALIAWLKSKGLPAPIYIATADTTVWTVGPDGSQRVEWTQKEVME